ncbi:MAG: glycosyltransferase family 2 protein [Thermoanaerobaculia bacterium]
MNSTRERHSQASKPPARVAAIVPAYNEEETLTDVLSVLRSSELVDEIIVVSDGSDDRTAQVAQALGVRAIELEHNHGKGVAMAVGVIHTRAPVLVFVDGDILNLSDYLLRQLIEPVTHGHCEMNIGIRSRGWLIDEIHRRIGPLLSGIRCLRREIFEAVPEDFIEGFRIEAALNWTCRNLGRRCGTTVFYQLRHRVKEKKIGLWQGSRSRFRMFRAVTQAYLELLWSPPTLDREPGADRPCTALEHTEL